MDPLSVARQSVLPEAPATIHFVGVGGIGMSGLARILKVAGYAVTGSDAVASDQTASLTGEGIPVAIGHADVNGARTADLLVISAAVREENPEVQAATEAKVPVVKRAALLGLLADRHRSIAVAGSHGKSTTSGMITAALISLGADPTYAIGATLAMTGTNAAAGSGGEMVVEADEYDHSFLALRPELAIITNIDFDHPDIFADQDAYDSAFARFVAQVRAGGTLVIPADDDACARIVRRADFNRQIQLVTFGESGSPGWLLAGDGAAWNVTPPEGASVPLRLAVPGRHNARNATAAMAAICGLGYEPAAVAAALSTYTGVGRRFERKGQAADVTIIDDYAHHPREIEATIDAARNRFPAHRIWAVFQPHTYSRTKALLDDFGRALSNADKAVILDIYPARETENLGVSSADLWRRVAGSTVVSTPRAAAELLARETRSGDIVLTMGAGDVTLTGPMLLDHLRAASDNRRPPAGASGPAIPGQPDLKVLVDSPMALHTTWRIGGPADFLVRTPNPDAMRAALAWGASEGMPVTVIGGGSNLLVGDGGIRGLVVLARTPGQRAEALIAATDRADHVVVSIGAQAPLSWAGRYAAEHGWAGLDWGVGLPGTIGGATVNNAGAHGTELKDYLNHVVVVDNAGNIATHSAQWLKPSYRLTSIKAQPRPRPLHVLQSVFHLPKGDPATLVTLAEEHAMFRKTTQPTGACAGSTFANPPGDFAGRLLEDAGLKGYQIGNVRFSAKHANWIVNSGNASAADVRALIAHARHVVHERFGVDLRQEIEELGEFESTT